MKKLLKSILCVLAGTMLFASCDPLNVPAEPEVDPLTLTSTKCLKVYTEVPDTSTTYWEQQGKFQFKMKFEFELSEEELEAAQEALDESEGEGSAADMLKTGSRLLVKFFPPAGASSLTLRTVSPEQKIFDAAKIEDALGGKVINGKFEGCTLTGLTGDDEGWLQADMIMPNGSTEFGFTYYFPKDTVYLDTKLFALVKDVVIDGKLINLENFDVANVTEYSSSPDSIVAIVDEYENLNIKYSVTFNPNYDGAEPVVVEVLKDSTVAVPETITRDGHVLVGWYKDAACTEENKFDINSIITEDVVLYAKWKEIILVTFVYPAETGKTADNDTVIKGETYNAPTDPVIDGYDFLGWFTDDTFETEFDFVNTKIEQPTTIYAKVDAKVVPVL